IGLTPPGWDPAATAEGDFGQVAGGEASWSAQLTCAGKYGCHGDHSKDTNDAGIRGAHHSNTDSTATRAFSPSTVGGSYRFLGGIKGLENSQWNWAETASVHNEYYGRDGNANYDDKTTINYSCAECHGDFHKTIGSTSPWVRHPTDIVLPDDTTKEYKFYNPENMHEYSLEAPVARPCVPFNSGKIVTPGDPMTAEGAIVSCLSCHRAHGSNRSDLLRWDYTDMIAGDNTQTGGCFICHTTKNN
ncbi:MAG: cytochrome c3 family protein, partial [Thermodesulfobacteriota bacterium]|nr:cytochrome c3 family protein [Thermodesulfobacteriota bacterium]